MNHQPPASSHPPPPRITHYALRITRYVSRPALVSLFALTLIYLAALVALPPDALTHHDAGAKYLQVRNLRLAPNGLDWSINYPARPLDPGVEFAPFNPKQHTVDEQGRIYLQWPIFIGLLTRLPWKLLGFWGLYIVPLLAGLGTAWAAYRLATAVGVPAKGAWLAIPLVGLATPLWIYSLLYFEHTLAALLVTACLLAGVRAFQADPQDRAKLSLTALSAALLAVAVYFRSELYILALVILGSHGLRALRDRDWRVPLAWAGAFMLALVPLWAFYAVKEGTILPLHATWYFAGSSAAQGAPEGGIELPRLRYIAEAGPRIVPDFLFGPQTFPLSPRYPFWVEAVGLLGVALCALAALGRRVRIGIRWRLSALLAGVTFTLAPALAALFSPDRYYNLHGFLSAAPFVALALWPDSEVQGSRFKVQGSEPTTQNSKLKTQNWLYGVTLSYVGLHTLVISALSGLGPISRHEWGQRYLLPAYPAMAVLAFAAGWRLWSRYGGEWRRLVRAVVAVAAVMALVGVGLGVRGYVMMRDERAQVEAWLEMARAMPEREPLVTDVWWLPLNLASDFYTRPMMLAEGEARLSQWAERMRERGVQSFGLMSNNRQLFDETSWAQSSGYSADGQEQEARGMWLQRYRLP